MNIWKARLKVYFADALRSWVKLVFYDEDPWNFWHSLSGWRDFVEDWKFPVWDYWTLYVHTHPSKSSHTVEKYLAYLKSRNLQ